MIMIHPTIETLRRLRLTGMAKALEEQQGLPDCDRLSFDERLAMLVDREAVERDNAALAQRLRLAKLRQAACLEDVDYRTPRGLDRSLIHSLASGRAAARHDGGHRRSRPACLHDPGYADPNRALARHDRRADDFMMPPSSKELCVVLVFSTQRSASSKG